MPWKAPPPGSVVVKGRMRQRRPDFTPRPGNKNCTPYKALDKLAKDPRVVKIWEEDGGRDGLWLELVDGYEWENCSCIHEYSVADLINAFQDVYRVGE